jgi:hypothetical protein
MVTDDILISQVEIDLRRCETYSQRMAFIKNYVEYLVVNNPDDYNERTEFYYDCESKMNTMNLSELNDAVKKIAPAIDKKVNKKLLAYMPDKKRDPLVRPAAVYSNTDHSKMYID